MSVESVSMSPGLESGERVFTSPIPYGIFVPFLSARLTGFEKPGRGDLVVVEPPYIDKSNSIASFFEPVANLITFQQGSFFSDHTGKRLHKENIKRIIAIPGDTIRIEDFIAYIKPNRSQTFTREDLLVKRSYSPHVNSDWFPEGWDPDLPFSGNMQETVLGENEYFVLGDNRNKSDDSRSWGPVVFSSIRSKVILRYWPFTKIAGY